jgi:hypothetical protein
LNALVTALLLGSYPGLGPQQVYTPAPYAPFVSYSVTGAVGAYSTAVGDFNNDGYQDVLAVNYGTNNVTLWLANANGTLNAGTNTAVGNGPDIAVAADFNGDGCLDFAVSNQTDGTIGVYLGNCAGTFSHKQTITSVTNVQSLAAAILGGGTEISLVAGSNSSTAGGIYIGHGDGTFASQVNFTGPNGMDQIVLYDVNDDGNPDIVTAGYTDNDVGILFGNGSQGFGSVVTSPSSYQEPNGLAVGDLNGDGIPEIAVTTTTSILETFVGQRTGTNTYTATQISSYFYDQVNTGLEAVQIGDFNGDGIPDLIVNAADLVRTNNAFLLFPGDWSAIPHFAQAIPIPQGFTPVNAVLGFFAFSDINGDGYPDIVAPNYSAGTTYIDAGIQLTDAGADAGIQLEDAGTAPSIFIGYSNPIMAVTPMPGAVFKTKTLPADSVNYSLGNNFGVLNATVPLPMAGYNAASVMLAAGTLVGTIVPEVTSDGNTWLSTMFINQSSGATSSSIVFSSSPNAATFMGIIVPGGSAQVRVRISAYTSGSCLATMRATQVSGPQSVNAAIPQPLAVTIVDGGVTAIVTQPLGVTVLDGGPLAVQGYTGGQPLSVQGSADGGYPVAVQLSSGPGSDGGFGVTVAPLPLPTLSNVYTDGGGVSAQGMAAGMPLSVQGSADGGLPLSVQLSSGPGSDGGFGVTVGNASLDVQGTTAGVPISVQGSADGGLPLSVQITSGPGSDGGWGVTVANLPAIQTTQSNVYTDGGSVSVQGTAAGLPVSIQGAADGGYPVAVQISSGPGSDGGFGVTVAPLPLPTLSNVYTDGGQVLTTSQGWSDGGYLNDNIENWSAMPGTSWGNPLYVNTDAGGGGGGFSGNVFTDGGMVQVYGPINVFSDGGSVVAQGTAAAGTAVSGNPLMVGGSDGTDARTLPMGVSEPTTSTYPAGVWEVPLTTTPFSGTSLTGTHTSTPDNVGPFASVMLGITYSSGVTGSPLNCLIQPKISIDGTNFVNYGTGANSSTISISPTSSTSVIVFPSAHPGSLGNQIEYAFTCGTYPTGGTFTMTAHYSAVDQAVSMAESGAGNSGNVALAIQGTLSGDSVGVSQSTAPWKNLDNVYTDGGAVAVQGFAGAAPISIQGAADGGYAVDIAGAVTVTSGSVTATPAGGSRTTPFSATSATSKQTSGGDAPEGIYNSILWELTWPNSGTGSPSGCTIQLQVSADDSNFVNSGPAVPITVGTKLLSGFYGLPLGLGLATDFVYSCSVYPTGAATLSIATQYSYTSMADRSAGNTWTASPATALLVGGSDGTNIQALTIKDAGVAAASGDQAAVVAISPNSNTVQGAAAGAPIAIQGAADGGYPVSIASGSKVYTPISNATVSSSSSATYSNFYGDACLDWAITGAQSQGNTLLFELEDIEPTSGYVYGYVEPFVITGAAASQAGNICLPMHGDTVELVWTYTGAGSMAGVTARISNVPPGSAYHGQQALFGSTALGSKFGVLDGGYNAAVLATDAPAMTCNFTATKSAGSPTVVWNMIGYDPGASYTNQNSITSIQAQQNGTPVRLTLSHIKTPFVEVQSWSDGGFNSVGVSCKPVFDENSLNYCVDQQVNVPNSSTAMYSAGSANLNGRSSISLTNTGLTTENCSFGTASSSKGWSLAAGASWSGTVSDQTTVSCISATPQDAGGGTEVVECW